MQKWVRFGELYLLCEYFCLLCIKIERKEIGLSGTVNKKSFIVQSWEGSGFGGTLSEKSVRHPKIVQKLEGVQVWEVSLYINTYPIGQTETPFNAYLARIHSSE